MLMRTDLFFFIFKLSLEGNKHWQYSAEDALINHLIFTEALTTSIYLKIIEHENIVYRSEAKDSE